MSRHLFRLLVVSLSIQAWAQSEMATLSGTVQDSKHVPIAAISVRITDARNGRQWDTHTSPSGSFTLSELFPGDYLLSIGNSDIDPVTRQIHLSPGERDYPTIVVLESPLATKLQSLDGSLSLIPGVSMSSTELISLPNLTRDPFRFAYLTGSASDAGLGTRGVGVAFNGQRESSVAILSDGVDNKDEFSGGVGKPLVLDSISAVSVVTGDTTADFGRASGGTVNVASKRGTSNFHGTAYDFGRTAALNTNSFQGNSNGISPSDFTRNQFGAAFGGPILRNKLFFFANTEVTLVRSDSTQSAWVPTPQLLAETAPNTQAFFQSLGQLRTGLQTTGSVSLSQLTAIYGRNPCIGLLCARLPATTPLFNHVAYKSPGDSGGGVPQNTWNSYNRLDYDASGRTRLYARYQTYGQRDQAGTLASSPYADYDLRETQSGQSLLISVIHRWNPRLISHSSAAFDRLSLRQQGLTARGVVPTMYANPISALSIGPDPIAFPGYNPFTPGSGGAFGGPQNLLPLNHDTTWTKGNHQLRFGGSYLYIRDNRTSAAYQTAANSLSNTIGLGGTLVGLLFGTFAQIQVAVDGQGQFPCVTTSNCNLTLPARSPDFSRSNRFHDGALYVQDHWRVARHLAVDAGVRWEYFGVQHNGNPDLDSNWYRPEGTDGSLIQYLVFGGLEKASKSSVGGLYRPDRTNFAPRAGVTWDVFGDGKTTVHGGYGISFDRNFGNVNFNVIQNLPNQTVLSVPGPITTGNFGPLAGSGSIALPPPGARIIDPDLRTAYAHVWDLSARHEISRAISYTVNYSGSKGVDLYSVSYPNQKGFRNSVFGDPCTGNGDCRTSPNPYYSQEVGYRGNQGFSSYYGVVNSVSINNLLHSGVLLKASYTWSHAVDNLSSTFFEAGGRGVANRYGDRNITVNNGNFVAGLLDPFQPDLDKGNADFDIRHRLLIYGIWTGPSWKGRRGSAFLNGWNLAPVFIARSGQPFSVFDTLAQTLDLNTPRATLTSSAPTSANTFVASPTPDTFQIITFQTSQFTHEPNLLTPASRWPANMSRRNASRAPGFWNLDVAFYKDTRLSEKVTLQLRAEAFNIFNHANLYVIGTSANVGASNTVDACFGCTGSTYDRRQVQLAARFSF